jgi:hypothetical protein
MLKRDTSFAYDYMPKSKSLYCLSGRLGIEEGMQQNNTNMVSEDNDGEYPDATYNWTIDLPLLLSKQLGRQLDQCATFRVKGLHLSLRNVNNTIDNDAALQIGGIVRWYSPTKNRVDALQHARQYKRNLRFALEGGSGDPMYPWQNEKHYQGLRFNWNADDQLDTSATSDDTTVLAGTYFSMYEIFDHYNMALAGTPAEEGRPTSGEGEALWDTRTGVSDYDSIYWDAGYTNASPLAEIPNTTGLTVGDDMLQYNPHARPWNFTTPDGTHLPVLGGLMRIIANHGNTDMAGWTEDEYYIQCSILVEGWEGF